MLSKEAKFFATNFRMVEIRSLKILSILKTKKCNYKISGLTSTVELFTLHFLVYFLFLIERSRWCKNGMQKWDAKMGCKARSFIMPHPLFLFEDFLSFCWRGNTKNVLNFCLLEKIAVSSLSSLSNQLDHQLMVCVSLSYGYIWHSKDVSYLVSFHKKRIENVLNLCSPSYFLFFSWNLQ